MTQNDAVKLIKCTFCNYSTKRNYDLKRHHNAKHKDIILYENKYNINGENVHSYCENVPPISENVHSKCENVPFNFKNESIKFNCKKCNKVYKSSRYLLEHEKKCNGLDELTCPRCMISFTSRQHKYNHLKKNNCNPRSIMYARKPNNNITNNIENQNNYNIEKQNNIETQNNIDIETQNNNITIHNYGSERIDYLGFEKMLEIFKKAYDIPSLLTKEIHFNINFPENNNIIDCDKNNYSLVKIKNEFIYKNLNNLVIELIEDKSTQMQKFAVENKDNICLKMDMYKYEEIIELLLKLILLKEPSEQYKNQVGNIRDMIRNSNK